MLVAEHPLAGIRATVHSALLEAVEATALYARIRQLSGA